VRVAVTRALDQADRLVAALEEEGAEPIVVPLIRVTASLDESGLDAAARRARQYDWIVFTSVNAVRSFASALERVGSSLVTADAPRAAAVGSATARALEEMGVMPQLVPEEFSGSGLAAAFQASVELSGKRILWPRARDARPLLAAVLQGAGAIVDEVEAYGTEPDGAGAQLLRERIDAGAVDVITFASPSAIRSFVANAGRDTGAAVVAVIGPVTAAAGVEAGLPIHVEPAEHTVAGLVVALVARFAQS
jgi:uroporphyrinogen III methyltransferase/synthase